MAGLLCLIIELQDALLTEMHKLVEHPLKCLTRRFAHHRFELPPRVAHCRQCLATETTAQVLHTLFPQS